MEHYLNDLVFRLYERARGANGDKFAVPVFQDPASIHRILGDPAQFPKNMGLIQPLGDSRFTANGQEWERRRDLTQRDYLSAGAAGNAAHVAATYEAELAHSDATPEGIHRALMRASSDLFFRSLGCATDAGRFLDFFDRARRYVKRLQYHSWNSPTAPDSEKLKTEGRAVMQAFAAEAAASAATQALMRRLRDRAGALDHFDPLQELLMNFFAGIETTAATLSFAIDRLGADPRVQQRLFDEIQAGKQEVYLNCFVQETMRYFPAIPFVVREAASDGSLNGVNFTKGQIVVVSVVGLHHNSECWNEPEIFDCSRAEFLDDTYNRRAFLPFLSGPRMCGGAKLAKLELVEGLRAFVRRFTVHGGTDEIGFDYGLALRPKSWSEVRIERRRG